MPQALSTQLNRIAEMARRHPNFQFGTLAHLINAEAMEKAFRSLQKNAAAGVDGVTAEEYGKDLNTNLTNLHERMKQGRYRAQPLRRVYIEKEDGKQRPLKPISCRAPSDTGLGVEHTMHSMPSKGVLSSEGSTMYWTLTLRTTSERLSETS